MPTRSPLSSPKADWHSSLFDMRPEPALTASGGASGSAMGCPNLAHPRGNTATKHRATKPEIYNVSVSHNYVSAGRMQSALNEENSATNGRMCIDSSPLYPYPEHLSLVGQVLEWGSP